MESVGINCYGVIIGEPIFEAQSEFFFFFFTSKKSNLHFWQQFSLFAVLLWEILCLHPYILAPALLLLELTEKECVFEKWL